MAAMSSRPRPTIRCEFGTLRTETSSLLSPARDPCCVAPLHRMGGQLSPGINQVEATSCGWKDWGDLRASRERQALTTTHLHRLTPSPIHEVVPLGSFSYSA